MLRSKFFILFFYSVACFTSWGDAVFNNKETLYSTRNGKPVGSLSISVEVKSLDANPKEFYLIIGDKGNEIVEPGKPNKSLWLFNRNFTLNDLKRNVKNLDITLDSKNFRDFVPFSENQIRFELKPWNEIRKQTRYIFYVDDAAVGKEITLKLHCYIGVEEKKKTTIDDDARLTLVFTIPATAAVSGSGSAAAVAAAAAAAAAGTGGGGADNKGGEVISLSEKISDLPPKEVSAEEEAQKQAQAQAADLAQRTNDANVFITVKNKEIAAVINDIEVMKSGKSGKMDAKKIDSIELVINELYKKYEYLDKGYTDILLKDVALQDKFTKFSSEHTVAKKLLADARQAHGARFNWLMPLGMGLGIFLLAGMFLMQIMAKIKAKKAQLQAIQKGLTPKNVEKKKVKEIDTVNISDLDRI